MQNNTSNKGVRNLFVFGSLFFFVLFVAVTYDTMKQHDKRVPKITEEVDLGKQVWHKYDCIGCHTIFGNGSYFAPDLTKTTKNKPRSYLVKFLVNPRGVNKDAVMPNLGITQQEAGLLVDFLDWTAGVDTNGWPPEPVLQSMLKSQSGGMSLYAKHGCQACHMIGGVGGTSGPDLTKAGANGKSLQWHISHLRDPQSVVPDSAMPAYDTLSDEDLQALAAYMLTLK